MRTSGVAVEIERDSRKLLALLRKAGFEVISTRGSHHKLRRGDCTVIVPHPKKDLPTGTARAILVQAGLME
jgi:predicted RNA binding protein YcfA (HicA-like mRNA interferase family)